MVCLPDRVLGFKSVLLGPSFTARYVPPPALVGVLSLRFKMWWLISYTLVIITRAPTGGGSEIGGLCFVVLYF